MSAYTRQKAKSKYRDRIRLERASQEQSSDTRKTPYDRVKRCRERKRMKASERINDGASTSAAGAPEPMQVDDVIASISTPDCIDIDCVRSPIMKTHWAAASARFTTTFVNNPFGHKCDVCDRLWFLRSLKPPKEKHLPLLSNTFPEEAVADFKLCGTCRKSLDSDKVPTLSRSNGFVYPPKQHGLPALDPISARLVSPRLPFMQIRRLRYDGSYGIIGQVINVPVDVDTMVQQLPRQLDDDQAFNVNIKKNMIHKSTYLSGVVKKSVVKAWLLFLLGQPLYKHYKITVNWDSFNANIVTSCVAANAAGDDPIEYLQCDSGAPESEVLLARQHTMLWNEENCLDIAPGQHSTPLNIIYDVYAEELSFPAIYYGTGRQFNLDVRVTPFMIATSEIRRSDRRGVTPEHILYMAMKIMRLRVVEGIYSMFRCIRQTGNITRKMLEGRTFLDECVDKNLAFLKSLPNSVQYWMNRKKDLFAMIRQLGKPSMFLTLSANEIHWPNLLKILHELSDAFTDVSVTDPLVDLTRSMRSHLVNEDPVTCCIYFNKLVDCVMALLQAKGKMNPFGKYRVVDFFQRIEFQHRGSPHAHILLWLDCDYREPVSESMPNTIQLVTDLCSVSRDDLPGDQYNNQVHRHTFTCTKRGETTCRFNIPYWPMSETRVLLPMSKDDGRRSGFQLKAAKLRKLLEEKHYDTLGEFYIDNNITKAQYLDIIRSTLRRPTLMFKRDFTEIYTNTFNPWIAQTLGSNSDLQFILEEYSCAAYVVEYVNKSNRGISHLHRELMKLHDEHPEKEYLQLLKQLSLKLLNTVEMSSQEAAWYLLRQKMSIASVDVVYIPTVWPHERQKAHKRKAVMDRERLDENSTDIWTKTMIQRYEDRPAELESICLADFVAWYTAVGNKKRKRQGDDDNEECSEDDEDDTEDVNAHSVAYRKRDRCRVIRYRSYETDDIVNHKREMVTLYLPFRCEAVDIIDRNAFMETYDAREAEIMEKRKQYESSIDIERVVEELRQMCEQFDDEDPLGARNQREEFVKSIVQQGGVENADDFDAATMVTSVSAVRRRSNAMAKADFCRMMRSTNSGQREILLEAIHRLHTLNSEPIQVFFTGPAGSGKTYVLKLAMEIYNRFTVQHNYLTNAFVACASTGKAAVNIQGVTVHSAFKITQSRRTGTMSREILQNYRNMFVGVKCVIIDEVSMIGSDVLHKINLRLQEITGAHDQPFGGMNVFFCGDFRQLPPVNATPVYRAPRNMIGGAALWQSLNYYTLQQVMRQSDATFSAILTKVGNGERLDVDEIKLIESRFRNQQWCDTNLIGVVRLYHQNHSVDSYNSSAIVTETYSVADDTLIGYKNHTEAATARQKLHKMSVVELGGLPYKIPLAVGYPYMITTNIDVEDGIVNGAIGVLKNIELLSEDEHFAELEAQNEPSTSVVTHKQRLRLWIEFPLEMMGQRCRLKAKPHVICKREVLDFKWTPITTRSANIPLGPTIKCHRIQFPIVPACAITIHKSQGGTFDRVVYQYDKSQQNQLVYVALSRVTSLDGLYIINARNDFKFYHGFGQASPTVREIRDEYQRLAQHPLPTLVAQVKKFCDYVPDQRCLILITAINAQSLVAHSEDISTDSIINRSDYLAISETWMEDFKPVQVPGFDLRSYRNTAKRRQIATTSSAAVSSSSSRIAGGVAIYRNINSFTDCNRVNIDISEMNLQIKDPKVGDVCLVNVTVNGIFKFILGCVYIHPGTALAEIKLCMLRSLLKYSKNIVKIIPEYEPDLTTPIMMVGDFNVNVSQDRSLPDFMLSEFNLSYIETSPTTLGNTCIDLTFTRNLDVSCMPFVSYFSYHRPIINKVITQ